jgi:hypothetical protein
VSGSGAGAKAVAAIRNFGFAQPEPKEACSGPQLCFPAKRFDTVVFYLFAKTIFGAKSLHKKQARHEVARVSFLLPQFI